MTEEGERERERKGCSSQLCRAYTLSTPIEKSSQHTFICLLIPTWINGATNNSPERIPCSIIKPVVKLIKSFFCKEAGGTVVEVPEVEVKVKVKARLDFKKER